MSYKTISQEIKSRILYLTVNRESRLNALNRETLAELNKALTEMIKDTSIGGAIITGSGPKAFVAGADIAEFAGKRRTNKGF
jgi:enoyl-CoA hydratase